MQKPSLLPGSDGKGIAASSGELKLHFAAGKKLRSKRSVTPTAARQAVRSASAEKRGGSTHDTTLRRVYLSGCGDFSRWSRPTVERRRALSPQQWGGSRHRPRGWCLGSREDQLKRCASTPEMHEVVSVVKAKGRNADGMVLDWAAIEVRASARKVLEGSCPCPLKRAKVVADVVLSTEVPWLACTSSSSSSSSAACHSSALTGAKREAVAKASSVETQEAKMAEALLRLMTAVPVVPPSRLSVREMANVRHLGLSHRLSSEVLAELQDRRESGKPKSRGSRGEEQFHLHTSPPSFSAATQLHFDSGPATKEASRKLTLPYRPTPPMSCIQASAKHERSVASPGQVGVPRVHAVPALQARAHVDDATTRHIATSPIGGSTGLSTASGPCESAGQPRSPTSSEVAARLDALVEELKAAARAKRRLALSPCKAQGSGCVGTHLPSSVRSPEEVAHGVGDAAHHDLPHEQSPKKEAHNLNDEAHNAWLREQSRKAAAQAREDEAHAAWLREQSQQAAARERDDEARKAQLREQSQKAAAQVRAEAHNAWLLEQSRKAASQREDEARNAQRLEQSSKAAADDLDAKLQGHPHKAADDRNEDEEGQNAWQCKQSQKAAHEVENDEAHDAWLRERLQEDLLDAARGIARLHAQGGPPKAVKDSGCEAMRSWKEEQYEGGNGAKFSASYSSGNMTTATTDCPGGDRSGLTLHGAEQEEEDEEEEDRIVMRPQRTFSTASSAETLSSFDFASGVRQALVHMQGTLAKVSNDWDQGPPPLLQTPQRSPAIGLAAVMEEQRGPAGEFYKNSAASDRTASLERTLPSSVLDKVFQRSPAKPSAIGAIAPLQLERLWPVTTNLPFYAGEASRFADNDSSEGTVTLKRSSSSLHRALSSALHTASILQALVDAPVSASPTSTAVWES